MKPFFTLLLPLALAATLAACRPVRYVPVESVHTEYKDRIVERRDSVVRTDSVVVHQRGDTVYIKEWHDRLHTLHLRDTAYVAVCDTTQIIVEVPRELTPWQRFKIDIGGIALGAIIALSLTLIWQIRHHKA